MRVVVWQDLGDLTTAHV